MNLNKPFDMLPATIAGLYNYKIKAHNQLIVIATALSSAPNQGVDYRSMTTDFPKLISMIEEFDHSIFESTPVVFATPVEGATLIDEPPRH